MSALRLTVSKRMNLASDRQNPPHLQLASTQRERTRSRQQGPSGTEEQTDPRCWPVLRVLALLIACYEVRQGCADWSREWSVVRAGKAPQVDLSVWFSNEDLARSLWLRPGDVVRR